MHHLFTSSKRTCPCISYLFCFLSIKIVVGIALKYSLGYLFPWFLFVYILFLKFLSSFSYNFIASTYADLEIWGGISGFMPNILKFYLKLHRQEPRKFPIFFHQRNSTYFSRIYYFWNNNQRGEVVHSDCYEIKTRKLNETQSSN